MRATVKFQQWRLGTSARGSLVSIKRPTEISAVVPCTSLDQLVVVAGEAGDDRLRNQEVRNCGMTWIGRTLEFLPRHEVRYELILERIQAHKILGERFEILSKRGIDMGVHSSLVRVKAQFSNSACRWQAAWRRHGQPGAAEDYETTSVHGRQQSRFDFRSQPASSWMRGDRTILAALLLGNPPYLCGAGR